ncbi:MAG: aldo/keto reductase [Clostridia bacterium]|nr:aldo/keto reductase [Clostridia bacterium]
MIKNFNDTFTLNNGVKVPGIGYGTWQTPDGDVTRNCVREALLAGYRHIDTASAYGNEASVGAGIRESGVKREDIFVTTKHWVVDRGYEKTIKAVETSLELLGLDYIDLYLIHWPCVARTNPNDWRQINADTWRGFEKMYKEGKIRALGVSNFRKPQLDPLFEDAEIKPAVNQVEFHPGYTQMENVEYCKSLGMVIEAWSPLGSGAVLADPLLCGIAEKYGKSTAQVCVRYVLQHDVLPLPKSTKPERMKSNSEVFDFEISEEDMKLIDSMPETGFTGWLPQDAPADALVGWRPPEEQ